MLGHTNTLAYEAFPTFDESALVESSVEVTLHICGKLRSKIQLPAGLDAEATESAALQDEKFLQWIEGKTIVKKIVIPGKMVNYVVK